MVKPEDQAFEVEPEISDGENTITQVSLRDLLVDEDKTGELPPIPPKQGQTAPKPPRPALNLAALQKAMTVCRRSVNRVPVVGPIMIVDEEGTMICKGTGHNISPKGMGAQVHHRKQRIEVGQKVFLEIFGNCRLKPFRAEAEVVNLYSRYKGGRLAYWGVGLRWTNLSSLVIKLLEDYTRSAGTSLGGFDTRERI